MTFQKMKMVKKVSSIIFKYLIKKKQNKIKFKLDKKQQQNIYLFGN